MAQFTEPAENADFPATVRKLPQYPKMQLLQVWCLAVEFKIQLKT